MPTKPDADGQLSRTDRLAAALVEGLPVTHRWLDAAGVSTSVLEGGDGSPVMLLHGQAAFAEAWGPVLPHLLGSRRIVAPDLPGLGRSQVQTGSLDGSRMLAWLDDLIVQSCAEPPTLVGISLGERFSRYLLAHPEHVQSAGGESPFVAYHVDRMRQPSVRAANRQLVRWSARQIPSEQLGRISVPVALIWGRNDRIMRFRTAEETSARFGWPLYPIDDCGHVPFAERPEAFLEALWAALEARPYIQP